MSPCPLAPSASARQVGGVNLHDWIDELCDVLDVEVEVDEALVLDLARDAAHNVDRPAAPITTFLLGYAAAASDGNPDEIERLAGLATALAGAGTSPRDAPSTTWTRWRSRSRAPGRGPGVVVPLGWGHASRHRSRAGRARRPGRRRPARPHRRTRRGRDRHRRLRRRTRPTRCSDRASTRPRRARPTCSGWSAPARSARSARRRAWSVGDEVCALLDRVGTPTRWPCRRAR